MFGPITLPFGAKVLLGFNPGIAGLGLLVAMYSVAAYEVGARRLVFLVVAGLGFVAGFVVFGVTGNPRSFAITVVTGRDTAVSATKQTLWAMPSTPRCGSASSVS